MLIRIPQLETDFLDMSLDNGNPSDLPGGGGKDPGDDDDDDDWGGAKGGRDGWGDNGLW